MLIHYWRKKNWYCMNDSTCQVEIVAGRWFCKCSWGSAADFWIGVLCDAGEKICHIKQATYILLLLVTIFSDSKWTRQNKQTWAGILAKWHLVTTNSVQKVGNWMLYINSIYLISNVIICEKIWHNYDWLFRRRKQVDFGTVNMWI